MTVSPLHILLSEDDDDDELLFRDALKTIQMPSILTVVKNGKELMETLYKGDVSPDVIFLDINMPFKNGLECLMEIRHDERLRKVPVVILSTTTQKRTVEITYELGANLYIAKPNSFKKLKRVLNEALGWLDGSRPSVDRFFMKLAD